VGRVMAVKRQIAYSRVAVRLMMAVGTAALMAGCSDASRFSDPFSDPFKSGGAPRVAASRGVDRAPTGAIASPAPARVESRPLPAPAAQPAPVASAPASAPAAGGAGGSHWTADGGTLVTVASGETAGVIATRYGVPTDALLRTNGYSTVAQVQPGARLVIPVYRANAVAHSGAAPSARTAPPAPVAASSKGIEGRIVEHKPDPKAQAAAAREEQLKAERAAKAAREDQARAERAAKAARQEEAKAKKAEAAAREEEARRARKAEVEKAGEEARHAKLEAKKAAEEARLAKLEAKKATAATAAESKKLAEVKAAEAKRAAEARQAEAKKASEAKAAEAKALTEKARLAKAEAARSKQDAAKAQVAKAEAAKAQMAKAEAAKAAKAERQAKAALREEPAPVEKQQKVAVAEKPAEPAAARNVDRTTTASIPSTPAAQQEATKVSAPADDQPEFRWPARGRIIQGFSSGGNDGINIAVPEGTPVKAAEGGQVAYAGSELKGYGNLVLIRHPNGFVTAYAHNGALEVKRGDTVKRGQTIAKSGQSGNVGSPQLHFELRKGSTPVDPTNYLAGL
jgi:murein DD-endopeptidase MepM/ murein hydrolase activator NlpD